jgi:type IV pilus assembly protein PilA
MRKSRSTRGFTLIELVVVCLIIGILAAIGIAQYNKTTERGRVAEAFNVFTAIKTAQQRYILKYNTFAGSTADLDQAPPTTKYYGAATITGAQASYTVGLTRASPTNPNYGAYTISYVGPAGTISCSNSLCSQDLTP